MQEEAHELQIHWLDYASLVYHAGLRQIWNNLLKAQLKCKMDTIPCENVVLSYWIYLLDTPTGYSICIASKDFLWLYVLSKMNTYIWDREVQRMVKLNDLIWPLQCLWSWSRISNKNINEL